MAFLIPYSLITQGLCTGIVTTISTMTVGSYKVIKSIYVHKNEDIHLFLKKLDIDRKLSLIESVISSSKSPQSETSTDLTNELEITPSHLRNLHLIENYHRSKSKNTNITDPIQLCLTDLSTIITEIHINLKSIDQKVHSHNRKWFQSCRTLNVQKELERLEINVKIMNDRYEDLIKISMLRAVSCMNIQTNY